MGWRLDHAITACGLVLLYHFSIPRSSIKERYKDPFEFGVLSSPFLFLAKSFLVAMI